MYMRRGGGAAFAESIDLERCKERDRQGGNGHDAVAAFAESIDLERCKERDRQGGNGHDAVGVGDHSRNILTVELPKLHFLSVSKGILLGQCGKGRLFFGCNGLPLARNQMGHFLKAHFAVRVAGSLANASRLAVGEGLEELFSFFAKEAVVGGQSALGLFHQ